MAISTETSPAETSRPTATGFGSPAVQLKAACAGTIAFGLLIALGSNDATDAPALWFADLIFWPLGDASVEVGEVTRLLAAILGGIMTGFGLLIWLLTTALVDEHPKLLQRLILTTMAVWFVVDGAGSIAAGAYLNLIGNLGFLAMFVVPAWRLA